MKFPNRYGILITIALLLVSLAALMQVAKRQAVSIFDVELATGGGEYRPASLPISGNMRGDFQVRAAFESATSTAKLRIIPDDRILSLSLNGEPVSLAGINPQQLRDYSRGFELTLRDLQPGATHVLELRLNNVSGIGGLKIRVEPNLGVASIAWALASLLILVVGLARHLPITRAQGAVLVVALLVSLLYLSVTNSYTRTFDVYEGGGHRDYIVHLIEQRSLPHPGKGWEYHQPPLYYTLAALTKVFLVGEQTGASDFWGQLLALYLWTIFLVASLATLRTCLGFNRLALVMASLVLCLWPSGIIHSIRIGNDVPLYAFYALAFYFTIKWWQTKRFASLLWAGVWASMALLTKSNALAVWAVLGSLFLIYFGRAWLARSARPEELRRAWKGMILLGCFFLSVLVLNLGNNVWHYLEGSSSDWLLSNVSEMINPGLRVENKPVNYLYFDLVTYLREPFISTWDDRFGRQYFWNFVWRSSLSSEFFFTGTYARYFGAWGVANGVLLLVWLAGILVYGLQRNIPVSGRQLLLTGYRHLPWLLAFLFPFLLLLAYRIKVPLSCNTDFRYIYPVLLVLVFYGVRPWLRRPACLSARLLTLGAPLIALSSLLWVGLLLASR